MVTIISRPVAKRCPYRDELDVGALTITFDGIAPELHDLALGIDTLLGQTISHEDFTAEVAEIVRRRSLAAGIPLGAQVKTTWNTGPWAVEVEATAGGE